MRILGVVAAGVLLTLAAVAQDIDVERTSIPGRFVGSVWAPVKTDAQGNFYVRLLTGDAPVASPLVRIKRDGARVTRYSAASIPGSVTGFLDFAPAGTSELYALAGCARAKGEPPCFLLARFNDGGKFVDSVRLDHSFIPLSFAAFSGGDFLMIVEDLRVASKDKQAPKAVALFDRSGHWIRNVSLADAEVRKPDHHPPVRPQPKGTRPSTTPPAPKDEPLDITSVQTADDGSVYITRFSPLPAVFLVSPGGQAVRYDLPQPEGQIKLHAATISGGRIIAIYDAYRTDANRDDVVYATGSFCYIMDLASGTRLDRFSVTRYGMLAGAEGDSLVYLVALPDAKLELQRAELQ